MKTIYLVDASSMFFRAYYAIRHNLQNDQGLPTNALYGFLSMSVKLLKEIRPDYIAYCFDPPGPSFRIEIDPEYKANRGEMPDDLKPQVPYLKKLTRALGIPLIEYSGYEADDVIGTLTERAQQKGLNVVIVSGDKDFGQLVNEHVTMYDTMKDIEYAPADIVEKWGVSPEQFIDYLALVGDSSDNVPGVKGVGKVTAQKLLSEFGDLDHIYENLESIPQKGLRTKLSTHYDDALRSRRLVTICKETPVEENVDELTLAPIQRDSLRDLLQELGFKSFEKNLLGPGAADEQATSSGSQSSSSDLVEKEIDFAGLVPLVEPHSVWWVIPTERAFYIAHDKTVFHFQGQLSQLAALFKEKQVLWKGYDLKKTWWEMKASGGPVEWDTMLAAYILRPGEVEKLPELARHYLGSFPELPNGVDYYAALLALENLFRQKLQGSNNLSVLLDLELPLVPILYKMERQGVRLDRTFLAEQSKGLAAEISQIAGEIYELAGEEFNIGSPKQLAVVLFDRLGLPTGKKTKTGFSTNTDVLEKLVTLHPICKKVLSYRELSKLKSTYVDALPLLVDAETLRLHTEFRQALTTTGRLSSIQPNLQNIPIRTARGRQVRQAFVAENKHFLLSADYSQIELRVLAHMSDDPGLIEAFRHGQDVHAKTASEVFEVALEDVTQDQRRTAKAVNFGLAYGQGVFGLAESLSIARAEAKSIIERYFERFPRVKEYMEKMISFAEEHGYVETVFGRRRYIQELSSRNGRIKKFGERAAINAPIQGTASDIVKKAMIEVSQKIELPLLLQVHDELVFEGSQKDLKAQQSRIKEIMENVVELKVPLVVQTAIGHNWDEAHA